MAIEVTRTYVGSIQNQRQVDDDLDSLGGSAAKIWNVLRNRRFLMGCTRASLL
ncbi:transposase, IS605 OrfB family protein [Natrialba hulunbeirensis JCM 10989]|uniref:Transposase, IS605 OrfB family protein n=1 Tax=Natrialba hulunbeirensis JCM 10989 TaxID=1227493 RepID=L9ZZ64_9EURY|nr:transposase, IS605 OrfB family protein [Natrialba hulunbeirensis JCM 10989]